MLISRIKQQELGPPSRQQGDEVQTSLLMVEGGTEPPWSSAECVHLSVRHLPSPENIVPPSYEAELSCVPLRAVNTLPGILI